MSHLRASEGELERFRQLIRGMSHDSAIYRMLRDELKTLGYWKAKPRGDARLGFLTANQAKPSIDLDA